MAKLREGMEVQAIMWPGDDEARTVAGHMGCVSLTVVMEYGQHAGVPWILAKFDDGSEYIHNAACLDSIRLKSADRE